MWKDKKFIVIAGLLVVLIAVAGTLGGLALTRQNNAAQVQAVRTEMLQRVGNILQDIKSAVNPQETLDNYLQKLVEDGKITQQEADQFKAWWDSRPDIPGLFSHLQQDSTNFFNMMHMGD
jgi:ABC-type dipeptide/oligopeptide/nickel transport system ATPase subunit